MTPTSADPSALATFRRRADYFDHVLMGVGDQWDRPSQCEDWTVRDLVDHVVGSQRDYLERQQLPAPERGATEDPVAGWRRHLEGVLAAVEQPGAAEREFDGYFGPTTVGDTLANFYGWDLTVHAWDVARATGQDWQPDDEEVARLDHAADAWGDALHSEGVCADPLPVPDDASPQERLLARLGREPGWTP